jgi:hypothetical protein
MLLPGSRDPQKGFRNRCTVSNDLSWEKMNRSARLLVGRKEWEDRGLSARTGQDGLGLFYPRGQFHASLSRPCLAPVVNAIL